MKTPLIFGLILFGVCAAIAEDKQLSAPPTKEIGTIKEPITVDKSHLLGLTEADLLKVLGITKLESEGKTEDKKSFPGGCSTIPPLGGYVYTRYNIVTFREGKVVQHEIVDRVTACVITEPRTK